MPNRADLFPSTTKKLHWYIIPSFIIATLRILIFGMHEVLYVCNTISTFMVLFSLFTLVWEKKVLYISVVINSPSLHVSILYWYVPVPWLIHAFNIATITNLMLWKLKTFLLDQTPMLLLLFLYHHGMYHEMFCIFCFSHLLIPVCSCFCILTLSDLLCHTLNSSCHRLDTFLAQVHSCSICNCYTSLFCLWNYFLFMLCMASNSLFVFCVKDLCDALCETQC